MLIRNFLTVILSLFLCGAASAELKNTKQIVIHKSLRILHLVENGQIARTFNIRLGANPNGHKVAEGDERTPEGLYQISYKKDDSDYHLALQISYPNSQDRANAAQMGVDPGGYIMIHGFKNGHEWIAPIYHFFWDWTDGCIAVSNSEIEIIWEFADIGTTVLIQP